MMRSSLRSASVAFGGIALILVLSHCVGDDPTTSTGNDDGGGSNDGSVGTDGNTSGGDGGAGSDGSVTSDSGTDSGPTSCIPSTGLPAGSRDGSYNGSNLSVPNFLPVGAGIDGMDRVLVFGNDSDCAGMYAARFKADGTLDTSYGASGYACIALANPAHVVLGGGASAAGEGLAVGYATAGPPAPTLAFFSTDGGPDFDIGGGKGIVFEGAIHGGAMYAATFRDDKAVVAGSVAGQGAGIQRFTTAGALDPNYANPATLGTTYFTGVAVGDGGVFAVGPTGSGALLYQTDDFGVPVNDAGTTAAIGSTTTNVAAVGKKAVTAGIDASGNIKVAMFDGTGLDSTFGTAGIATPLVKAIDAVELKSTVAVQCDGKIIVIGGTADGDGGAGNVGITRLNANGSNDTAFGTTGVTTFTSMTVPIAVLTTSTGHIIVVSKLHYSGIYDLQLTRFSQ